VMADTETGAPLTPRPPAGPQTATRAVAGPDWRHVAACRDEDAELFFPVGTRGPAQIQIAAAKAVCARCAVVDACLLWALARGEDVGVWGGMDETERRRLRGGSRISRSRPLGDVCTLRQGGR